MARNLFLIASLAALAGCQTPTQPPSPSGMDSGIVTAPAVTGVTATPVAPATPASAPASGKLPLGNVRRK